MMAGGPQAWRIGKHGLHVLARVSPKSVRDGIEGLVQTPDGPALKVRVRAVAEDGAANRSVETLVAQWLGVARTSVTVGRGAKARIKTLHIDGRPEDLEPLMAARVAALQ